MNILHSLPRACSGRDYFEASAAPKNGLLVRINHVCHCIWDSLKQLSFKDYPLPACAAMGFIPMACFTGNLYFLTVPLVLVSMGIFNGIKKFKNEELLSECQSALILMKKVQTHFERNQFVETIKLSKSDEEVKNNLTHVINTLVWYDDAFSSIRELPFSDVLRSITQSNSFASLTTQQKHYGTFTKNIITNIDNIIIPIESLFAELKESVEVKLPAHIEQFKIISVNHM
jgi:hypothetical protein